jgi:SAM-dependent methyltransferase
MRCVAQDDAFYEEAYLNEVRHLPGRGRLKDWAFFSLLQSGVFGKLRRVLTPDSVVVDLGCASGVRWLGNYHTIGIDLSLGSVRKTTEFYEVSAQASAGLLPIASESVDVVYSSYFFEHVPLGSKDAVLQEMSRVMRPGAACVLLFDVLSDGPFGRFARRDSDAFRRGFIEPDGHLGLEPLSRAAERIERAGLTVEQVAKFGTTALQYMASYRWLANAYGDSLPWVRQLGRLATRISASRMRLPVDLAVTAFDTVINRYTLPDKATRVIVVARK